MIFLSKLQSQFEPQELLLTVALHLQFPGLLNLCISQHISALKAISRNTQDLKANNLFFFLSILSLGWGGGRKLCYTKIPHIISFFTLVLLFKVWGTWISFIPYFIATGEFITTGFILHYVELNLRRNHYRFIQVCTHQDVIFQHCLPTSKIFYPSAFYLHHAKNPKIINNRHYKLSVPGP